MVSEEDVDLDWNPFEVSDNVDRLFDKAGARLQVAEEKQSVLKDLSEEIRGQAVCEERCHILKSREDDDQVGSNTGVSENALERLRLLGSLSKFLSPQAPPSGDATHAAVSSSTACRNDVAPAKQSSRYSSDYSRFALNDESSSDDEFVVEKECETLLEHYGPERYKQNPKRMETSLTSCKAKLEAAIEALPDPNSVQGKRLEALGGRLKQLQGLKKHVFGPDIGGAGAGGACGAGAARAGAGCTGAGGIGGAGGTGGASEHNSSISVSTSLEVSAADAAADVHSSSSLHLDSMD
eukprot:TRINITY_DN12232_c2_g1_i1.p1 TRINITY_DN12232_c2_g1~~TRINITY_DN12232_c2_g1_i1.p1  ORF type:complete len:295 (+),score=81.59 TRINITY_DN12232_c2_g1_i1:68-952(+)